MKKIYTFLLVTAMSLLAGEVYAASRTFYFQATATSGDAQMGLVAASFASAAPAADAYAASVTTDVYSKSAGSIFSTPSSTNTKLYLYAQPAQGYKFIGWADSPSPETFLSTNASYNFNVTSASQDAAAPETFQYYAFFVDANARYSSSLSATAATDGGQVAVSLVGNDYTFGPSAQASALNAEISTHTYYLAAAPNNSAFDRFIGWYADAACQNLLSTSQFFTYSFMALSGDPAAPTAVEVYAKFESRDHFQFWNAGFESWNANLTEPTPGWSGPASAIGSMAGIAAGSAPAPKRVTDAHSGNYAVQLTSKSVLGVAANGNLTTGVMNMGSISATSASNNNHTIIGDPAHSLILAGQPDSIEFYTKFKKGENKDYMGSAKVYLHGAYPDFQDPVLADMDPSWMGYSYTPIPESADWYRNVGPIGYRDSIGWTTSAISAETLYALCVLTTNPTAGGSQRDTIIFDDIRFIYNSELAAATYEDEPVAFVNAAAAIDKDYVEANLAVASNGRQSSHHLAYDAAEAVLTITVMGADVEFNPTNQHVYTIQFKKPAVIDEPDDTALEDVVSGCQAQKVMIDGQIYLIRGNHMFDLFGRIVR